MSDFSVEVVEIDSVEKHPNADRLDLVHIGGYVCIANKKEDGSSRYAAGDLVVYIPEAAKLPEWLLKKLGFWDTEKGKGMLTGSKGDRIKAIRLRQVLSQGVLYPVNSFKIEKGIGNSIEFWNSDRNCFSDFAVEKGMDVANILGITKWEPEIPATMRGSCAGNIEFAIPFDVENGQKFDKIFNVGEEVVASEKLHGTFCCLAYVPNLNDPELLHGCFFASSKGMIHKGLYLKNTEDNAHNIYHRFLLSSAPISKTPMTEMLAKISAYFNGERVFVMGEIFGRSIQDLTYGLETPEFRCFDIFVGPVSSGRYINDDELEYVLNNIAEIKRVPVLYRGPFSMEKMIELRDGNTYVDSAPAEVRLHHIREGIVVKTCKERSNRWLSRTQFKLVSPAYLLRKGGTEFN